MAIIYFSEEFLGAFNDRSIDIDRAIFASSSTNNRAKIVFHMTSA